MSGLVFLLYLNTTDLLYTFFKHNDEIRKPTTFFPSESIRFDNSSYFS